jgi:MFS transporter, Spinster family, sphingosine-1-phosphate transporter
MEIKMPENPNNGSPEGPIWPHRRTTIFMLLAANMLSFADRYTIASTVPGLRKDIFGDPETYWAPVRWMVHLMQPWLGSNPENTLIGLLNVAFFATYMIGAPGVASMKAHRMRIIGIGIILWSVAAAGSGLATTFGMLLLARSFVGIGEACAGPITPTIMTELFPADKRAIAMGVIAVASPLGAAIGYYNGGFFTESSLGWRWAFYIALVPGILLGVPYLFMRDRAHERKQAAAKPKLALRERLSEYTACLRVRSYTYNMLASAAMTFALGGIAFWAPSYIVEYRGLGHPTSVSFKFGVILAIAGITASLGGGWLADRMQARDPRGYMKMSGYSMIAAIVFSLAMIYRPFPEAWFFLGAALFFLLLNMGATSAIVTNVIPPEMRAAAFAFLIFATHALGDVSSPFVIGAIADATGGNMNMAFMVMVGAIALAGLLWLIGARHLPNDSKYLGN